MPVRMEIDVVVNPGCRYCQTPNPDGLPVCSSCGEPMPPARRDRIVYEADPDNPGELRQVEGRPVTHDAGAA
jgi:hypothetical protein